MSNEEIHKVIGDNVNVLENHAKRLNEMVDILKRTTARDTDGFTALRACKEFLDQSEIPNVKRQITAIRNLLGIRAKDRLKALGAF